MLESIIEFISDYYVYWMIVGFITGIIDLKHYYKTKGDLTAKHILDLLFFMFMGIIGTLLFLNVYGNEIVLIKKKEKK